MEFLGQIETFLTDSLGEFGPLIAIGVVGLLMIMLAVPLMLQQREDPLDKLKRQIKAPKEQTNKRERLREGGRNEKLEKFAGFLEPKDVADLSAMQLTLRQAGYQTKDAVRFFHFTRFTSILPSLQARPSRVGQVAWHWQCVCGAGAPAVVVRVDATVSLTSCCGFVSVPVHGVRSSNRHPSGRQD